MFILHFFSTLFAYDFMRDAIVAGTLAAIVSSMVGYFVVLRNQNFASHALSHIGFAGATGAGLIGLSPTVGQLILTAVSAVFMGCIGDRAANRDVAIGLTLAVFLGLGMLFLYFYTDYAGHAMSILFGNIFGVSTLLIKIMLFYSLVSLLGLLLISNRLILTTLEPDIAEAKGISLRFISVMFLLTLSIAVTEASQVVGILLVSTLIVGPAASAICCTRSISRGLGLSVLLGIAMVWVGIILSYITNWPVSFWVSLLSFLSYLCFKNLSSAC